MRKFGRMSRKAARGLPLLLLLLVASASIAGARSQEEQGAVGETYSCGKGISRHSADSGPLRPRATEVWIENDGRCELHAIYVVAHATQLKEPFCVTAASAAEYGYVDLRSLPALAMV